MTWSWSVSTCSCLVFTYDLSVIYVWQHFSLFLGTDCTLFTDGIEKAEPLDSNYITIFFVETDALENVELIKGT